MHARPHDKSAEFRQRAPQRRQILNPQLDFPLFSHSVLSLLAAGERRPPPELSAAANFRYYTRRRRFTSHGYPTLAARTEQADP